MKNFKYYCKARVELPFYFQEIAQEKVHIAQCLKMSFQNFPVYVTQAHEKTYCNKLRDN